MSDIIDRAQAREAELLEEARERIAAQIPRGPSRLDCAECGDRIPAARRAAVPGCKLCIDCQAHHERRRRRT